VPTPTQATSERFGYGWIAGGRPAPVTAPIEYHLHAMQSALGAPPFTGRVLDAGCGEGIDLASVALSGPVRAVGVELSNGGIAATSARIEGVSTARLIQGNVLSLPFAGAVFDGAYSYGVVHHTVDPEGAVREIARVLKPGAMLLLYVYEDFSTRSPAWRAALALTNLFRQAVSAMSPANIRRCCAVMAPLVYVTCTWPSKHFAFAKRFPYPATQNPTLKSLVPDLYDRFAAPIEKRYSERGARALAEQAGCRVRRSAFLRGWAVWAEKI
jgi:ubiquinone/menaquinone biosynthesis C-methylase UbiE